MLLLLVTVCCLVALTQQAVGNGNAHYNGMDDSLERLLAVKSAHRAGKRFGNQQELHDNGDIELPIWRFG